MNSDTHCHSGPSRAPRLDRPECRLPMFAGRGPPCAGRLPDGPGGRRADGGIHRDGHALHRLERRPALSAQRSLLVPGGDRRPGRNRPTVGRDHRQRRAGEPVRVVQGPVGGVVADHAAGPDRGDQRPGPSVASTINCRTTLTVILAKARIYISQRPSFPCVGARFCGHDGMCFCLLTIKSAVTRH